MGAPMIPPGPASHTHDTNDRRRDREIRLVQARDQAIKEADALERSLTAASRLVQARDEALQELESLAAQLADAHRLINDVDLLHQPDPDNNHACQCGLTFPCPTRRALDGGTP